jgi:hypothetical protein
MVTDQLYRYEELLALHLADSEWLQARLKDQQQVILALDGLQPDVGHEVLWVLRDGCPGEVLGARSLLGATENDLVPLLEEAANENVKMVMLRQTAASLYLPIKDPVKYRKEPDDIPSSAAQHCSYVGSPH